MGVLHLMAVSGNIFTYYINWSDQHDPVIIRVQTGMTAFDMKWPEYPWPRGKDRKHT